VRRPTARQSIAAALVCLVAAVAVVGALVGADRVAVAAVAVLIAGVALLMLDVRHRQQVSAAQVRSLRSALDDTTRAVADVDHRVGSTTRRSRRELRAVEQGVNAGLDEVKAVAEEASSAAKAAGRSAGTAVRSLQLLEGRLLTEMQALDQLRDRYSPREPLPIVGGWALGPVGLLWLVDHIEQTAPRVVVECGSGTSTLWIANALRQQGHGHLVALEHSDEFAGKTRAVLAAHGLEDWATVRHAPLVDTETPRGTFRWYDVEPDELGDIDLLLVDGPPGTTGPLARYPALPRLGGRLNAGAHVLVDDVQRADEQESVAHWLEEDRRLEDRGRHGRAIQMLVRR
jgi:predicted O-methyltransferase YrrM